VGCEDVFQTTQHHIPRDYNVNIHLPDNTKSHIICTCLPIWTLLWISFTPYINLIAPAGEGSTGDDDATVAGIL
jgi:hypothetical protein